MEETRDEGEDEAEAEETEETEEEEETREEETEGGDEDEDEDEVVEWEDEDEDELVESHLCLTYPPLLATWLPTRGLWRRRRRRIHRRGWRGRGWRGRGWRGGRRGFRSPRSTRFVGKRRFHIRARNLPPRRASSSLSLTALSKCL
jgi:hypothetical protein